MCCGVICHVSVVQQHNIPLFTAQVVNIKHVCKVNIQMLTWLKFANWNKRLPGT